MHVWKHFKTITKHKLLVMRYCFRVGLYKQGLLHDMSKYSWTEFRVGCKYYQGNCSPNNAERLDIGLSTSWLHHKGRNRHHFEYWVDYGMHDHTKLEGVQMPRKYVAEMVMDRICASRVYNPSNYTDEMPFLYYKKGAERLWFIHDETKRQLGMLLEMLATRGEKETLSYIRNTYLKESDISIKPDTVK